MLANARGWELLFFMRTSRKKNTNTTLLPGFINCWHFLELLGITQPLTQHEPGWRTQHEPGGLAWMIMGDQQHVPTSVICWPGFWHPLQWPCPHLVTQQHICTSGLEASCASQAIGWDTHGSWGTRGAPWLSPEQKCQCWEKDWAQLWLLGIQGLHKRLYNTPLPGVGYCCSFGCRTENCKGLAKI